MTFRFVPLLLILALLACDEDSTSPGTTPTPTPPDRALDLNNFFGGEFVAPGTTEAYQSVHQTGVVTIEAWIFINGFGRTYSTICTNRSDVPGAGFSFGVEASDGIENRRLRLTITDENGNTVVDAQAAPGSFDPSGWAHVSVASDGSQVRFAVDRVEQIVTPTFANLGSTAPAARNLTVGSTPTATGSNFGLRYPIDELRIWGTSRSAIQLAVLDNGPLQSATYNDASSGLLGYWPFDTFERLTNPVDGTDDLRDRSLGGHHLDAPTEARLIRSTAFAAEI